MGEAASAVEDVDSGGDGGAGGGVADGGFEEGQGELRAWGGGWR